MNKTKLLTYFFLAVSIFLITCSDMSSSATKAIRHSEVQIDLRSLKQMQISGSEQVVDIVTVVDSLTLNVLPSDGTEQVHRRKLDPSDLMITIGVEVAVGLVEFNAEILSNNSTQIYTKSTSTVVREDDFEVQIQMNAVDAVLVIAPDTLVVDRSGQSESFFWVLNIGREILEWQITEVEPSLFCGDFPCLEFERDSGRVLPGDSIGISTRSRLEPGTNSTVRIGSNVGQVELNVHAADSI